MASSSSSVSLPASMFSISCDGVNNSDNARKGRSSGGWWVVHVAHLLVGDGLLGVGHELLDGIERHLRLNLLQHLLSRHQRITHHHQITTCGANSRERKKERKKVTSLPALSPSNTLFSIWANSTESI
jgi:hypothetical protein